MGVGSIAGRDAGVALSVLPLIAAGLVIALGAGRSLNALALGDDVARSLGQRVGRARLLATVGFVLLAGGAVAAAGPIAFVGLAVPHIARVVHRPRLPLGDPVQRRARRRRCCWPATCSGASWRGRPTSASGS